MIIMVVGDDDHDNNDGLYERGVGEGGTTKILEMLKYWSFTLYYRYYRHV